MTFTSTTIRKLRALGLEQTVFDAVLEIFEEARESKPKKVTSEAKRTSVGTRLPEDWSLPAEWREWAQNIGLQPREVNREATAFKNYWLNCADPKGKKLRWDLTWQTWCRRMLERLGREPLVIAADGGGSAPPAANGPEAFTDATWQAIAKRFKSTGQWNSDSWGPPPGRMDCRMPDAYL
jgi:hypothetical protein